jgi:uncharacterized protein
MEKKMKNTITSFNQDVINKLGYYVYILLDPDTKEPFYIGKGKANRIFHHLKDSNQKSEKVQKILELHEIGKEPILEILKYGLTEEQALLVESTAIDLIGIKKLTNIQKGHGCKNGSRSNVKDLAIELTGDPESVKFEEPGILIKISRRWSYSMSAIELYDSTRSCWVLSKGRIEKVKYAFAVYDNIIREVYDVRAWLPAGSSMVSYERGPVNTDRMEFIGVVAEDVVRKKYLGKNVGTFFPKGAANPVQYVGKF